MKYKYRKTKLTFLQDPPMSLKDQITPRRFYTFIRMLE